MKASVIITGSEILKGIRHDMLIQPIASAMVSRGICMGEIRIIGDDPEALSEAVHELGAVSDIVIVTGGLGLTPDDTTHTVIGKLQASPYVRMNPEIENPVGSARGIDIHLESGARVVFLPGVPREALAMFGVLVHDLLPDAPAVTEITVFGLRETEIARRLGPLAGSCAFLPRDMEVALIVPREIGQKVREILKRHALDEQSLSESVGTLLKNRGITVAAAESCTGGLISHLITQLPGSSAYFKGSVVSYSNDLKTALLGVPADLIDRHGAVSREVAEAMLKGVLEASGADMAMATTGIAGPAGGSEEKPVGTVWIAAGGRDSYTVKTFLFPFDRQGNKMIFAKTALFLLREWINDTDVHSL